MDSLKRNDMIILQNQKSVQTYNKDSKNDSSGAIIRITNWYQEAAERGDNIAQYNLGCLYEKGEGTEKNLEKAFYWYQKAAENGNIEAHFNLALLYKTEKNLEKAIYWYQKASENGHIKAQNNLALLYEKEKNLKKAFYW